MSLSADVTFAIASASICAALILVRCGYRLLSRCKSHVACHRSWHSDDAYMAFALLPLVGRTTCIAVSFVLNPNHAHAIATVAEAGVQSLTVAQLEQRYITSYKLLIGGRICYALFLWSLKLCLLNFYSRFVHVLRWGEGASRALWWFIVISFVIVLITTLADCQPMHLMWSVEKHKCQKALGNLVTMAVFNILTDIALIIFPFPILRYIKINTKARLPLIFLFCLAGFVVAITIIRLPLILNESVSQRSRSMWASIEILCACVVANTAFYYAFFKEVQRGHDTSAAPSSNVGRMNFYHTPSQSRHVRPSESLELTDAARHSSLSVYAHSGG
ncbi:hypothetical protein B0T10DRAFT_492941 [Thelonectria olida]|uniref:Rhodopsin domain-containing protein n=1 Tax=Thelonectria olida TaxID=1576542 RepID=A0A9P8W1E0_9HYPO|nr:hypothetical protein B0T10DRAFT_492941 [Thelonectria olida]